ncbi:ribonucleotide-diphosphate reductase subunit beta [Candidatus Absconditicoccus praedator]|uniref:ribonucleotide-diphosphate reductase subunit beta n=1 Tax=Candidatus Absconditicoccus praedator TaxID=2735562 RepID=UPI001E539004|nr:ribonucleotide-diphosphate reductase subunit beta [Candidatus Absconditicoccus praedator]UFX82943.1 ribonucleotide-diphosphate reductase subunit beta [Candidatus Absconditicoccus praedator]
MSDYIKHIKKRSGKVVDFDISCIEKAISKAFDACNVVDKSDIEEIVQEVMHDLQILHKTRGDDYITVETIQDHVEKNLIKYNKYEVAKAYILYREKRANMRKRDIFKKRTNLKPYEYPELYEYVDAIRHSYWVHTEFNYTSDVQDFHTNVTDSEKAAIKKSMLAIAQVEVAVKAFWGDVYKKLPKPEIAAVGFTFAESEVRHMDAYSHLLEILGLNEEFDNIDQMPVLMERVKYLEGSKETSKSDDDREYSMSILLFSLFIEHVSLFSQFLIMMSFNKYKNLFKGISNAVEATSKEEHIHGLFGIDLINTIKEEHPEWFDEAYKNRIYNACYQAYESEKKVVEWILEDGELDFLPKEVIFEFIKNRLNNSLQSIGLEKAFEVDEKLVEQSDWFEDEIMTTKHNDFFNKRSINYNKRSKSITSDDLF